MITPAGAKRPASRKNSDLGICLDTPKFTVFIPGTPVPQGSMRGFVIGGRAVLTSASSKLKPWRKALHDGFECEAIERGYGSVHGQERPFPVFTGPVCVSCEIILPRLASHPKTAAGRPAGYPVGKGDLDKHQRSIGDALTTARIVGDDGQICQWNAVKRYALIGEAPGALVEVSRL